MATQRTIKIAALKTPDALRTALDGLAIELPFPTADPAQILGAPITLRDGSAGERVAGNRFAVLPMEGWDGTADGRPTELVRRRWRRFGDGGAKLVWCEATAVRPDGRANPHQLVIGPDSVADFRTLREELEAAHRVRFGRSDDLVVGLQLTHSGRFARPDGTPRPRTAFAHPWLDGRVGADADAILSDDELDRLCEDFVTAALRAADAGFHFVDVKHCHGYLLHELLAGRDRAGRYGGTLENRTRMLRDVVGALRAKAPGLAVAVRLSAFDFAPFHPGEGGVGEPETGAPYRYAFGGDDTGTGIDLGETHALLDEMTALGIGLVCVTAGSPYYCPHVQRPAAYPPSDGYRPPEDPLVGVARQLAATAEIARRHPGLAVVGSGYSYLQEWLPHVGAGAVECGGAGMVGLGRMALSYPDLPARVLAGDPLEKGRICRTFSDCTTGPRNGMISGCFPLDPFYNEMPEAEQVAALRRAGVSRKG